MEPFEAQMGQVLHQLDRLRELMEPIADVCNGVRVFVYAVLCFAVFFAGLLAVLWAFFPERFRHVFPAPPVPRPANAPAPPSPPAEDRSPLP